MSPKNAENPGKTRLLLMKSTSDGSIVCFFHTSWVENEAQTTKKKTQKTQKTHSPRMNSSKIYLSICSLFTQNYLGVGKWGESLFPSGLAVDLFITFRFPGFCLHLLWQRWWFFLFSAQTTCSSASLWYRTSGFCWEEHLCFMDVTTLCRRKIKVFSF